MCLLPMSHLFGQAMSLYIPPLLGGAAVLTTTLGPAAVISSVKRTRVSVLTVVPRMLLNLREELQRRFSLGDVEELGKGWLGAGRRWWKFRRVHSTFGFKFWCLVVGGASVGEELESFWRKLGFLVVQGYGLTESSPVISVNHPFDTRRGSAGKVIAGQDVRIAEDGEILVRGASVASEFTGTDTSPRSLVKDGWLHTGDLGEIDREGRIYIRGRKKEVIVTSAGLNVFPEDVEKALAETPGIHEAVAIGLSQGETEIVHAVVILEEPALEVSRLIQLANRRLEEHQRISSWTVWPRRDFPRTPSTEKIKRREVARQVEKLRAGSAPDRIADGFEKLIEEIKLRKVGAKASSTLSQDLELSSLDRVELMSRLEDHFGVDLDEERFSELTTVGELEQILGSGRPVGLGPRTAGKGDKMPRWAVRFPFHLARRVFQACIMGPLFRHYMELKIENLDRLGSVRPPVLFAANHASHLDTVALLVALPPHWRSRVTPAMRAEFFRAGLDSPSTGIKDRASRSVLYLLACGLFGAYPLPQRMAGVRSALKYTGELVESGFCPLVFPEGRRSPDGKMRPFQPGLGLMAQRLRVPVVPVKIEGTFSILSVRDRWPRRGVVSVKFAPPMTFREADPTEVVCQIEGVVRDL
jgi:long-chain acyl-CoA synthetase